MKDFHVNMIKGYVGENLMPNVNSKQQTCFNEVVLTIHLLKA